MSLDFLSADYGDCIEELDFGYDGWREDSDILNTIKSQGLVDSLAMSFFEANPGWMDECVPAAVRFQLEWLANLFGDTSGNDLIEETRYQIFRYISESVVAGLLHWESNGGGFDYE